MARGSPIYAKLEVSFMRRPEWLELNPAIRILYLSLWCYALDCHRQAVKKPSARGMAALTGLKACQCDAYLSRLHALGYLIVGDETITMCGIADKHPKYIWYDSPNGDQTGIERGSKSPHKEKETETETETEKETLYSAAKAPPLPVEIPGLGLEAEEIPEKREDHIEKIISHYKNYHPKARPGNSDRKRIQARLKEGWKPCDIMQAIDGCHKSPYHCGKNANGMRYQSLELITRDSDHIHQFFELANTGPDLTGNAAVVAEFLKNKQKEIGNEVSNAGQ